MKIGVNTLFLIPGEVGGTETYLRDILRHAVPRHPDIDWVLFTNAENHASFERSFAGVGNVSLYPMKFSASHRPSRILREQCLLPLAARRAGVDVLWSPGYTAPFRVSCPQVVTVHDMQYCEFPEDLSPVALWATRLLVPVAVRAAVRVIAVSEFSRDQIVKYVGIPAGKIIPIHSAAGPEFSRDVKRDGEGGGSEILIPSGPYVLCVANTYPHKNVHALVDAFGLMAGHPDTNLVLVGVERLGEGLVRDALNRLPQHRRGCVKRLSRLDRRDLIALYQGAKVFAFPSLYEGFGLPVLEAMAAGVPVVTAERGPMREIGADTIRYCDGTPAALARQMDDLLRLEGAGRDEVVWRAKERALTFTWERTADETVAVMKAAVRTVA